MVIIGASTCGALIGSAFAVAPWSCDSGLSLYFGAGIVCLTLLFVVPFVLRVAANAALRAGPGLVLAGAGAWTVGLFIANVRFVCRPI